MFRFIVVCASVCLIASSAAAQQGRKMDSGFGDMRVLFKVFQECSKSQFVPCLKHKLLTAIDRVGEQQQMEIFDGVMLVKDPNAVIVPAAEDGARSADDSKLDAAIVEKVVNFFKTRNVQFKLLDEQPRLMGDGRKKNNKYNSLLMMPFMMGGMTIPLAFGTLALLAGKALIIAKLALVLSAIIGLKKLFGDHGSSHEYVSHGGSHYRRSLPGEALAASNMAYSSYMPVAYDQESVRSTTENPVPL
ncbi:uncharacterized protein LOC126843585 [Adelges cooleyi]|uniref:uncharacterized protein LOC126843585 n=1 Tax=Adelges cooleyi TaxID=133065 RepID=UPI00218085CE|nr:uncharacterized protein LOC126843585 [Adelges cooleyi]